MHVGFEIENQVHHEDPQSKKHEQPRVASADSTTFRFGLARGLLNDQPDFPQKKMPRSRRFLFTARPISYIMLTKKSGRIHTYPTPPGRRLSGLLPLSYFLSAVFPSFNWASS
jgi:hypothetical protein